ncbi:MAG: response regulator [Planctomycetes bacterium]|nr:response regulator [Planctomycetota bacterium]
MRNTLSTIAVAKLLGVAVASISTWIDAGQLKAGRTPGGHRRVAKEDLIAFLRRQKLPIPPELQTTPRILIVDDEQSVTEWIAQEIKSAYPNFEIFQANDGYAAGEMVASAKPDVVILDLRMPGMDGFEVCRRIKSREETKEISVIAITAHPSDEVQHRILEAGATVCFTKPLDVEVLLAAVESALPGQL